MASFLESIWTRCSKSKRHCRKTCRFAALGTVMASLPWFSCLSRMGCEWIYLTPPTARSMRLYLLHCCSCSIIWHLVFAGHEAQRFICALSHCLGFYLSWFILSRNDACSPESAIGTLVTPSPSALRPPSHPCLSMLSMSLETRVRLSKNGSLKLHLSDHGSMP